MKSVEMIMEGEQKTVSDADDRRVIETLAGAVSGMSAEDLGTELGMDKMLLFYRLDRLVKQGLLKRSRPMFMQPELYEVTEPGRGKISS